MTFATLRALHAIIGTAIDDIERVYRPQQQAHSTPPTVLPQHLHSPPTTSESEYSEDDEEGPGQYADESSSSSPISLTPHTVRFATQTCKRGKKPRGRERANTLPSMNKEDVLPLSILKQSLALDWPSLDAPIPVDLLHNSEETMRKRAHRIECEALTSHPSVISAVNKIVAACGQLTASVQKPFLVICDASMGYHLPACLRFLEASHTVEILREAGPQGLHVGELARRIDQTVGAGNTKNHPHHIDVDTSVLSHILRLLATHHITREVHPDVFANNRISSAIDSGKSIEALTSKPCDKYEGTDGIAAFVGLCTDELFKASAYLADRYLPTAAGIYPSAGPAESREDTAQKLKPEQLKLCTDPILRSNGRAATARTVPSPSLSKASSISSFDTANAPAPGSSTPARRPGLLKKISSRSLGLRATYTPTAFFTTPLQVTPLPEMDPTGTPPSSCHDNATPHPPPYLNSPKTPQVVESSGENMKTPKSSRIRESPLVSRKLSSFFGNQGRRFPRTPPSTESLSEASKDIPLNSQSHGDSSSGLATHGSIPPRFDEMAEEHLLGPAFDYTPSYTTETRIPTTIDHLQRHFTLAATDNISISRDCSHVDPNTGPAHRSTIEGGMPDVTAYSMTDATNSPSPLPFMQRPAGTKTKQSMQRRGGLDAEMHAPFNIAFGTELRYFDWLEKEENAFRLLRFGKAMAGTAKWEVPGSVLGGFPWEELPESSIIIDVGGGIGSTSMILAKAFPHLRLVIQDRPPVVEMGIKAWRARHPEMLDTGRVVFQAHDFFRAQPVFPPGLDLPSKGLIMAKDSTPAVFLLRAIVHDWPDSYVTRILLRLRHAAGPNTKLLLAEYILPLASIDEDKDVEMKLQGEIRNGVTSRLGEKYTKEPLPGTVRTLAPEGSPLLPNLGKANSNAYWLDLTMRATFNSQERTLRELATLTLLAGWKVVQVTRAEGSLFGHIVAIPVDIPEVDRVMSLLEDSESNVESHIHDPYTKSYIRSPLMGNTFLTRVDLPSEDTMHLRLSKAKVLGASRSEATTSSPIHGKLRRGRRERAHTVSNPRDVRTKDGDVGGEPKKGWRSIVKMLSKAKLGDGDL